MVASLTRAAAAEVAGRDLPISKGQVGTLHSHAYHALSARFDIVSKAEHLLDWNKYVLHHQEPAFLLSVSKSKVDIDDFDAFDEAPARGALGDAIHNTMELARQRMLPEELRSPEVRRFSRLWTDWKQGNGFVDFTDLIEFALRDVEAAPGKPDALFIDEAQDSSALEVALVRKWAQAAQVLVFAGDSDQAIFSWRGADPKVFFSKALPPEHVRVLAQSYRVPVAVHRAATSWVQLILGREPVAYHPREEAGAASYGPPLRDKERIVGMVEDILARNVDDPNDPASSARNVVMLLASCSYMLEDLKKELRRRGVPFHNPYRRKRHDWNPLHASQGIPSSERLLAFLRPFEEAWGNEARDWTAKDLRLWLAAVRTRGLVAKQGLERLRGMPEDRQVPWEELISLLNEEAVTEAVALDMAGALRWLEERVSAEKAAGMAYPLQVARLRKPSELRHTPRVVIGTVHSTKGGEGRHVFLWPDLSPQGFQGYRYGTPESFNATLRVFYVGMTRARDSLTLGYPGSAAAVSWPTLDLR